MTTAPATDFVAAPPCRLGAVGIGILIFNALTLTLWGARLFKPDFLAGPLIPCLALALLPGSLIALLFRHKLAHTFYRVGLAGGLLVYLVLKKTLAPDRLWALLTDWQLLAAGAFCLAIPIFIGAWRWQMLLCGQKFTIGFWTIFRLTLVSYFFNTFIPGANGGDIYRFYQLAKIKAVPASTAATTVLLDRFLGTPALMLCVLIGVAANLGAGDGAAWAQYHYLVRFLGGAAAIALGGSLLLLAGSLGLHSFTARLEEKIPGGKALAKVTAALAAYREQPRLIIGAAAISAAMHAATLAAFWFFGQAAKMQEIGVSQYLFLVFAGLSINYIPVSPGGIGLGELGFETLFQMAPPFLADNGAAAATMMIGYRLAMLFYGAMGWLLYVGGKHRLDEGEIKIGE
ncbi:MAG: flippase-like domain-containing protein [Planctomycetota bacterium]|jgi:uncharacterized membrane protein YbhN (UPF0104 family)|nr:flippase-like domain-containing protein [Planctomycetota bacterium]